MNQPTNIIIRMESDPMGGMFSQMFDRMQPMEPENTMPASEADTIRAEEESRRLNRQVAELRSHNSTAALVGESDAQEATLRSQRDGQIAQRDQEERTCVHRKGKTL